MTGRGSDEVDSPGANRSCTDPSGSGIERRIFVVGAPRSGTTLVQSLLAAHSRVTSFPESHLFSRHFRVLPGSSAAILVRDPVPRLRRFLEEAALDSPALAAAMLEALRATVPAPFARPIGTRRVARQLLAALDCLASHRGFASWAEKTPMHLRYVPFLERLCAAGERPRFVHVIREGVEVVASLREASRSWERPYDLDTCVRRWNEDLGLSLARIRSASDRFIFYEELTSRPEATLARLFAGLDLEWEPEVLERYSVAADRLVVRGETWKANLAGGLRRSATSGSALTEEERKRVTAALQHDLYARIGEGAR